MGVGHLDIGIGKGGAQVFGSNPAIDQFADMLAQRRAKQEKDNKFLNDQLATTYDPGSLRNDTDKSTYIDRYNKVKEAAIDAENEKNDKLKAMKISQVRQQLGDLSAWGEGSKKQAVIDRQLGMEFMKNAGHYEDDSVEKYKGGLTKRWDDPDVINNPSQVERRPDATKMEAEYQKTNADMLKNHPAKYDSGTIAYGPKVFGKKTATLTQNRVVPYEDALEMHLHRATADVNYKKYLRDKYPDIKADNPQHELTLRVMKDMQDHGDDRGLYDKPKTKDISSEAPDKFYAHYDYALAHPKAGQATSNMRSPSQIMIAGDTDPVTGQKKAKGIVDNDPQAIEKFVNLIPKGQYGEKFDPSSVVKVDPTTGVQTWTFPEHVEVDSKAKTKLDNARRNYEANPDKTGYPLISKNRKVIPFEETEQYKQLAPQVHKPVKNQPKNTYTIDPSSPDAASRIAEMGTEQHVNFKNLNDIEGQKSGHGQIKEAQGKQHNKAEDFNEKWKKLPKGATLVGPDGVEYTKQ